MRRYHWTPKTHPSKHQTLERIWKTREWSLGSSIVNDSPTTIRGNWNEIHLGFCEGFPGPTGPLIQTPPHLSCNSKGQHQCPISQGPTRQGGICRQNSKRQFLTDSLIGSWEDPFISWLTIHPYISRLYFIPYKKQGITTRWFNSLPFYIPVGGHQQPLTVSFNHPKKVTIAELPGSYFLNKM